MFTSDADDLFKIARLDAGIDWDLLWSSRTPQMVQKAAEGGFADEVDWRLSSLALSQPLRYEYDSNCKLDLSGAPPYS